MKIPELFPKGAGRNVVENVIQGKSASSSVRGMANDVIDVALAKAVRKLPGPLPELLGYASADGPYKEGRNRDDPLYEVNWSSDIPLGLPSRYLEEITLTEPNFMTSEAIPRDGYYIYVAEKLNLSPISAVFFEDRLLTVASWLSNWNKQISSDGKTRNYPSQYKKTWTIWLKDVKGVPVGQLNLHGVWPTTGIARNLASLGSERVRVSIEFSVDRMVFKLVNSSTGGMLSQLPGVSSAYEAIDSVSGIVGSAARLGSAGIGTAKRVLKF